MQTKTKPDSTKRTKPGKSVAARPKAAGRTTRLAGGVTPYLIVKDAPAAIAFYVKILGAKEDYRLTDPSGKVGHAELVMGDGKIFLADESPSFGALAPPTVGGTPVGLHFYVADVDAVMERARKAGALVLRPAADQFYGDRADPFGHHWYLATRQKTVSPREMQKIFSAMFTASSEPVAQSTAKTRSRKRLVHS
jgi:PhnB protein